MTSTQTLSDTERRALARWAAACAARVRPLYAADAEHEEQIRDALARALAYGHGGSTAAAEIRQRMVAVKAASAATTPAGAAAARAVAQAAAGGAPGGTCLGCRGIRRQGRVVGRTS